MSNRSIQAIARPVAAIDRSVASQGNDRRRSGGSIIVAVLFLRANSTIVDQPGRRSAATSEEEHRRQLTDRTLDLRRVIAIDGPAAAGKTTVARDLADRLGAMLFDTGALYRSVTLAAARTGIPFSDGAALTALTETSDINLQRATVNDGRLVDVLLNGEDVTWAIRSPEVDANVSEVSAHPGVRAALLPLQRRIASGAAVVMVGRDIASVVAPEAGVKIYLDASVEERARRRAAEMRARGLEVSDEQIAEELRERDRYDSTRALSPLVAVADAIVVDTDDMTIPEVVDHLEAIVRERWAELGV
jgi:cytidylate kinase